MGILIQSTVSKFSKTKNQTQKGPLKFQKVKNIYKEASNKKNHKTDPPKSGNSDSNTILKYSKTKDQTKKRPPKVPKNKKKHIRRPQIKKFY